MEIRKSKGRNLILGIIDNYTYHDISLFLLSLQKTNYDGHVCFFAGPNISQGTVGKIRKHGVELISYQKKFPFITTPHKKNFPTLPEPIHIYNFRHFLYFDYLLHHEAEFDNVLLTDVRDVIFQRDPFDFDIEGKIHVAVENSLVKIRQNPCTAKWIDKGYGKEILSSIEEKEVICAGTTLAPARLMMSYLERLIQEFFQVKDVYKCADQAMHNVLIHTDQLQVRRCYNFRGPFLTLDTEAGYQLKENRYLINENGEIVNTVHQYDRHPELLEMFVRNHGASSFWIIRVPQMKERVKETRKRLKTLQRSALSKIEKF